MSTRVLLVDDDADIREALGQTLELADLNPTVAGSFVAAKDYLTPGFDGVVVSDIRMPGRDGFYLLDYVREVDPDLPVILLTGEADIPMAVRGMSAGAYDFLEKPCAPQDFVATVRRALAARHLALENRKLKAALAASDAAARLLPGGSRPAEGLRGQVRRAARMPGAVLITGVPGADLQTVAEALHALSDGCKGPFLTISAAIWDQDVFQAAAGGTLFVDDIASLDRAAQLSLLGALTAGASTRLVAGAYSDLAQNVADGGFDAALLRHLEMHQVRLPPLQDRIPDIPVLFQHYAQIAADGSGASVPDVLPDYMAHLMMQDWQGDALALKHIATRFVNGIEGEAAETGLGLADQMAQMERALLVAALRRHQGRATQTAKSLQLPRKTFYDKLAKHGLRPDAYRR
ncbi:sigma-54 dependent transcriptional regulator [Yoonia sp. SS1-5]|uniref:Sigma-54-dependent transcriptional regulator n=1 Tax=Yoonia rhodophyticola TaxID=3137370 RepID=A0AAN0NHE4_9RHOB